jgi:hypothetical protein
VRLNSGRLRNMAIKTKSKLGIDFGNAVTVDHAGNIKSCSKRSKAKFCYICGRRATKNLFGHNLCKQCETEIHAKRNAIINLVLMDVSQHISTNYIIEFMRANSAATKSAGKKRSGK